MTDPRAEATANRTAVTVAALLAAWQVGQVDTPGTAKATAVAVFVGKAIATRLADVAVSTLAQRPPVGIRPSNRHLTRLEAAAFTVLEDAEQDPAPRLDRLARAEVEESHQRSTVAAIEGQGFPEWEWVASPGSADECAERDGQIYPGSQPFEPPHPRCACSARPVGHPAPVEPVAQPIRPRLSITRTIA